MSEERVKHDYVIVRPGDRGHASDNPHAHLVVEVNEWVQVHHKEKDRYDFVSEHGSFDAAHNERNRLNDIDDQVTLTPQPETAQPEIAVDAPGGVQWLGEKATT